MADRNLSRAFSVGFHTTEEGMVLFVPNSDFLTMNSLPGKVDPFAESTTQQFPLGTELWYGDRKFRYARMGATVGVAGNVYQSVVPRAGHIDAAVNTYPPAANVI